MNKLWLIIQREYLTRVTKKSFIIATLITPLAMGIFFVVVGFIMSYEGGEELNIGVVDEAGVLRGKSFGDDNTTFFTTLKIPLEEAKAAAVRGDYDGILAIPPIAKMEIKKYTTYYYSDGSLGLDKRMVIQKRLRNHYRDFKIEELELDKEKMESVDVEIAFQPEPLKEDGEKESSMGAYVKAGIGGALSFVMYMAVFIYGMMVMRSVSEEKVSRIVEVMISSVKPFQLMLGKIIGVGAVGLTQVTVWAILLPLISLMVSFFIPVPDTGVDPAQMAAAGVDQEDIIYQFTLAMNELGELNWLMIAPMFLIFFLGGYFLYASMFAAVGSAVGEDTGESQSLTIPITIPIIIAFYIMFVAIRAPHSTLAIWASIFPLFSPIVMPARLAFDPPFWQVALSVILLIGTVIFFVWLSGRIYRVGILMYGKKASFKELAKWVFYSSK